MKKKNIIAISVSLLTICIVSILLLNGRGQEDGIDTWDGFDELVVGSGSLPDVTIDEIMESSTLVIKGKVVSASDSFKIMGAGSSSENGAPIFTDYYIEPEQILRGET